MIHEQPSTEPTVSPTRPAVKAPASPNAASVATPRSSAPDSAQASRSVAETVASKEASKNVARFNGDNRALHLAEELFLIFNPKDDGALKKGAFVKALEVLRQTIPSVTGMMFNYEAFEQDQIREETANLEGWFQQLEEVYAACDSRTFSDLMVATAYALRDAFNKVAETEALDQIAARVFAQVADKKSGNGVSRERFPVLLFAGGLRFSDEKIDELWRDADVKWGNAGYLDLDRFKVILQKHRRQRERCEIVATMYECFSAFQFQDGIVTLDNMRNIMTSMGTKKLSDDEWLRFSQFFKGAMSDCGAKNGLTIPQYIRAAADYYG